jgi:hypothetical protein
LLNKGIVSGQLEKCFAAQNLKDALALEDKPQVLLEVTLLIPGSTQACLAYLWPGATAEISTHYELSDISKSPGTREPGPTKFR